MHALPSKSLITYFQFVQINYTNFEGSASIPHYIWITLKNFQLHSVQNVLKRDKHFSEPLVIGSKPTLYTKKALLLLHRNGWFQEKTPQAGLEPATPRLTAECSAIELLRIISCIQLSYPQCRSACSAIFITCS